MMSDRQHFKGRVVRARDAAAFLALGESTFWRFVQQGRLPKGIRLSARATVWRLSDLEAFIEQQVANQEGVHHEQ
jgi:predicted DNA-binding transcriptional regulator AlpA